MRLHRLQRPQHLQFFIAHPIGFQGNRRLHRDQTQQLQHMVLHHVAHGARLVVVAAATFQPNRFRHRDLHMVDHVRRPQTLKNRVGEAQRHQVLHRLLAQIVVDTERLRFGEDLTDLFNDRPSRGRVMADRFF